MEMTFASYDGMPVLMMRADDWSWTEAWTFADHRWQQMNSTEAFCQAPLISRERYAARYGWLPMLPDTAFQRAVDSPSLPLTLSR